MIRIFREQIRIFVLSVEDNAVRKGNPRYFLQTVKTNDYQVTIDGKIISDKPLKMI